jgi:hypothetical protein
MPNEEHAAEAREAADLLTMTFIPVCYATHCRFNVKNACMMRSNEIAKNGQCMNFEVRSKELIRKNLEDRGIEPEAIENIMRKIEEKEAGENVSH